MFSHHTFSISSEAAHRSFRVLQGQFQRCHCSPGQTSGQLCPCSSPPPAPSSRGLPPTRPAPPHARERTPLQKKKSFFSMSPRATELINLMQQKINKFFICFASAHQVSPKAALAAAEATLGSTTEARKATVLMTGFPDWLKGMGW